MGGAIRPPTCKEKPAGGSGNCAPLPVMEVGHPDRARELPGFQMGLEGQRGCRQAAMDAAWAATRKGAAGLEVAPASSA